MNIRILRIKNRTTGLYARKGEDSYPAWSKKGKVWTQLNHVHSHIQGAKINRFEEYLDSDVVEIMNGEEVIIEAVADYIAKHIDMIIEHFQYRLKDYKDKIGVSETYMEDLRRKLDRAMEIQSRELEE